MSRVENGWKRKLYSKTKTLNYAKSLRRFDLLKINENKIHPQLRLNENDKSWVVSQKIIPKKNKFVFLNKYQLTKLAKKIDEISSWGLVHGDLCFSNIGFDREQNVLLYDWEINLEVVDKNKLVLQTTPYCLHPMDHAKNNITILSDRFSIAALTMISCHNPKWRSNLSYDQDLRRRVAGYIDSIATFSNEELVERMLQKIENNGRKNYEQLPN